MKIYVVIGVFQGVISDVSAFLEPGAAYTEQQRLIEKYGIEPGHEEESEHNVQLHEVDVDARPASVVATQVWW